MEPLFNKLKHLTLLSVLYPLITFCYGVIVVAVFYITISSLHETLNRPFQLSDAAIEAELPQVNLKQYELIIHKLNLPPSSAEQAAEKSTGTEATRKEP